MSFATSPNLLGTCHLHFLGFGPELFERLLCSADHLPVFLGNETRQSQVSLSGIGSATEIEVDVLQLLNTARIEAASAKGRALIGTPGNQVPIRAGRDRGHRVSVFLVELQQKLVEAHPVAIPFDFGLRSALQLFVRVRRSRGSCCSRGTMLGR